MDKKARAHLKYTNLKYQCHKPRKILNTKYKRMLATVNQNNFLYLEIDSIIKN